MGQLWIDDRLIAGRIWADMKFMLMIAGIAEYYGSGFEIVEGRYRNGFGMLA
jgi:hypothetical protein